MLYHMVRAHAVTDVTFRTTSTREVEERTIEGERFIVYRLDAAA